MANQKENKMNYYNTGKVKIGINYQPKPYVEYDKDMLFIQRCLLNKNYKNKIFQFLYRILYG